MAFFSCSVNFFSCPSWDSSFFSDVDLSDFLSFFSSFLFESSGQNTLSNIESIQLFFFFGLDSSISLDDTFNVLLISWFSVIVFAVTLGLFSFDWLLVCQFALGCAPGTVCIVGAGDCEATVLLWFWGLFCACCWVAEFSFFELSFFHDHKSQKSRSKNPGAFSFFSPSTLFCCVACWLTCCPLFCDWFCTSGPLFELSFAHSFKELSDFLFKSQKSKSKNQSFFHWNELSTKPPSGIMPL